MTIFDNAFLENLKNAIIKCNINKSLISKLLSKTVNAENPNDDNSLIKNTESDENPDILSEQNQSNTEISHEEKIENFQSNIKNNDETSKNLNTNLNNINDKNVSDIHNDLDTIYSNNKDIEQFLFSIIPLIEKYIQAEANKSLQMNLEIDKKVNNSQNSNLEKNASSTRNTTQNTEIISEKKQTNIHNANNLIENTLIISETQGKVFLPYFITDLEEISKCNDNMPFDEIIEQKYTLPISNFKALSISRFREAFKLARNKEKKSFKFAFDLGLEVLFDYNLHPAIIAACRTLDELDIYLDCLDSGETDKFECFNIKFEIPPVLIKK